LLKILVIRFSSIGDIVLTSPVLRGLKEQAGAEVHVLVKKTFAPLVQSNPNVAKVFTLPENIQEVIEVLKQENYDWVIDLHHNLRSKRIKLALGRPSKSFPKLNIEKWLLVQFGLNRLPNLHIVDRYLSTVAHLKVKRDGKGLDIHIPLSEKVDVRQKFSMEPGQYVVIAVGAAHATKCMTADQIRSLCDQLHMPVILLGGREDIPKAEAILAGITNTSVKNAAGQLSILQSASVIEQSGKVITHDTGMMHIAAALKKPQVVVWGNTIPQFGMYPYYGDEQIRWISFEQAGLSCRPCSKLGYEKCPKGHFKCMLLHDISKIVSETNKLKSNN
jgi:ADP-heptose:LPS heptosyltransferase